MQKEKKNKFLQLPKFPGGKKEFQKFIMENIQYPAPALEKRVQGTVFLTIQVSDEGAVTDAKINKGIGYGCDEEAVRLVKLLQYEKCRNRGLRVSSSIKIKISFVLPPEKSIQIAYSVVPEKEITGEKQPVPIYSYTINF